MNRRHNHVIEALKAGPMSATGLARHCGCRAGVLYAVLSDLIRKQKTIIRLPGRRYDLSAGDATSRPVIFYQLAGPPAPDCLSPPSPGKCVLPVKKMLLDHRDRFPYDMATIRARKASVSGAPAGPCYCRGFANWGSR